MDRCRILSETIHQLKNDKQYLNLQSSDETSLINNFEYYRGKHLNSSNYKDIFDLNKNKESYLMLLLPHLIDFCHHIYKNTEADQTILFKSRDCYFIKKLFEAIYPGERDTQYVFISRKACYTNSNHFKRYINQLTDLKSSVWVDIQGSGDSHVHFFKNNFNHIPKCIFFRMNTLQRANSLTRTYKKSDYQTVESFKPHYWRLFEKHIFNDCTEEALLLEALCRAPHASVIDVNNNLQPIHEETYDLLDKNLHELLIAYEFILDNYWHDNHFKLRSSLADVNQAAINKQNWKGLAAFDIDETITHDDHGVLEEAFKACKNNRMKVIFITARWDPFYENHNGKLLNILPRFKEMTNHPIELWFNPMSRKGNNEFNDLYKAKQLEKARIESDLSADRCMLIDNVPSTVEAAKEYGFVNSICVPDQHKTGITEEALKMLKNIMTA